MFKQFYKTRGRMIASAAFAATVLITPIVIFASYAKLGHFPPLLQVFGLVVLLYTFNVFTAFFAYDMLLGRRVRSALYSRKDLTEKAAAEQPGKPQLAWVAGRVLLETYLDRNIRQVRTIATLTYLVMTAGFIFILYGLVRAFNDPNALPVAIVASASGIVVSFIGGSFLLVYRSLLIQTKEYIFGLERINGVGMSMSVIEAIPEESKELRAQTMAQLAKDLLTLYGANLSRDR
jgi:hypothetical protein